MELPSSNWYLSAYSGDQEPIEDLLLEPFCY